MATGYVVVQQLRGRAGPGRGVRGRGRRRDRLTSLPSWPRCRSDPKHHESDTHSPGPDHQAGLRLVRLAAAEPVKRIVPYTAVGAYKAEVATGVEERRHRGRGPQTDRVRLLRAARRPRPSCTLPAAHAASPARASSGMTGRRHETRDFDDRRRGCAGQDLHPDTSDQRVVARSPLDRPRPAVDTDARALIMRPDAPPARVGDAEGRPSSTARSDPAGTPAMTRTPLTSSDTTRRTEPLARLTAALKGTGVKDLRPLRGRLRE